MVLIAFTRSCPRFRLDPYNLSRGIRLYRELRPNGLLIPCLRLGARLRALRVGLSLKVKVELLEGERRLVIELCCLLGSPYYLTIIRNLLGTFGELGNKPAETSMPL